MSGNATNGVGNLKGGLVNTLAGGDESAIAEELTVGESEDNCLTALGNSSTIGTDEETVQLTLAGVDNTTNLQDEWSCNSASADSHSASDG